MRDFKYSLPTKIILGERSAPVIESELGLLPARKALVVTGRASAAKTGALQIVTLMLGRLGIDYEILHGCAANPDVSFVNQAGRQLQANPVDLLIAVGGGSVMDATKGIALLATNHSDDLWLLRKESMRIPAPALPVVAIPTTIGTGSECNGSFALYKAESKDKFVFFNLSVRPVLAWCNPDFVKDLPTSLLIDNYVDILSHCLEQFFAIDDELICTDYMIAGLCRYLIDQKHRLLEWRENVNFRANTMLASSFAMSYLFAQGKTVAWSLHQIADVLSCHLGMPHGTSLAYLLPGWLKYVSDCKFYRNRAEWLKQQIDPEQETDLATVAMTLLNDVGRDFSAEPDDKAFQKIIEAILANKTFVERARLTEGDLYAIIEFRFHRKRCCRPVDR